MSDDLVTELRHHETEYQELVHGPLCGRAADAIEKLRGLLGDARSNCIAGSREDLDWDKRRAEALA